MTGLALRCDCGALTGHVEARTAKAGLHIACHCRDCRAFQVALGRPDPGALAGVEILQITPEGLTIEGEMALMRLSPRGPLRFYSACCGAPIATTATSSKLPFAGMLTSILTPAEALGPLRAHLNIPQIGGGVKHRRAGRTVRTLVSNALGTYLRGARTQTPFFDPKTGAPTVPPVLLDKSRKAEVYRRL